MIVYSGALFPQYRGNLLIGALSGEALIRVSVTGDTAKAEEQWAMGARIRDVAQAPDGAIWVLEDDGALATYAEGVSVAPQVDQVRTIR